MSRKVPCGIHTYGVPDAGHGINGNIVETWTSGKEPHYIEKLPIGKYTLKEEQAPNGYVVAEEITFEVADTAEIQKVAMKDDTAKGRLIIEKTDKDTGAALKDAEFELRDADGKVVETMTTDENGHATRDRKSTRLNSSHRL